MKRFYHSLTFRIGGIIVLAEVVVLAVAGAAYVNRFSAEVDQHIEENALLPGALMNAGLLSLDSVADQAAMRRLVGEELIAGMIVGVNGNVFYSLQSEYVGQTVDQAPGVDVSLFDPNQPQESLVYGDNRLVAVSPIFGADGQTPRFFVYVTLETSAAEVAKAKVRYLFVLGSVATVVITSVALLLAFHWAIFARIAALLQILARAAAGDLSARVEGAISQDEIGALQRGTNAMIASRQQAEERIVHLNRVLRAIRNINQLIVREKDRDRLLQSACDNLVEARGYLSAWIALLDEGGDVEATAAAGLGKEFSTLVEQLNADEGVNYVQEALRQSEVVVIKAPFSACTGCRLLGAYGSGERMAARLEHGGRIYGLLTAYSPEELVVDGEERALFGEVAGDIAFALHSVALEEQREQAQEALKEYAERLEEMVEERTAELRQSEEQSRAQYKGTPVPTYTWQKVGDDILLADYNDAAEALTQGKIADFMGIELREMYRDTPEIREEIERCFAERTTIEREMRYRFRSTGEERHLAVKYAFVPPDRVLIHTEDITERVRAEQAVAQQTTELRKMVNAMAGREVRMAELKDVIRKLRAQLAKAGLEPMANDPLLEEMPDA
ncbi:MAG: GAF domain-containing protein [Anaerolineae bacterium]|nr:GAF domain-containing protein [Anaerolineae bacterium]